jgi:hypothetical protein
MKSKEEIKQLAEKQYPIEIGGSMWMPNTNDIKKANEQEGFIKGYTQCQEDMANESIRFAEWINKNDYGKIHGDRWCKKFMSYTHSTVELFEIYINSLNK